MRTIITCLLFGLLFTRAAAQDDPKSRAIIDRLIEKSKGYTSFEAAFSSRLQSTKDKLDVQQVGTVKVKGKRFRLQMDDHTIINDGKAMWTYSKKSNEVTITDPAEMDQDLDPSKIFTVYEKGFKSQLVEEKTEGGVVVQVVKLFPLEAGKKPYHTIILTVDKAKNEPRSIQVLYKDGNIATYTVKSFTANPELADALFIFDKTKFPGVEVNDMR
ncbi:MAG: outer membrane lipoprotein carrier protein LolA [Flavobacteriales bacterium]|nr:outer membrane lipoprotein carrier protein LolA [Flavobacteriales bacterium]